MRAKLLKLGLTAVLCSNLCGCMTYMTVRAANGGDGIVVTKANGERVVTKEPKPDYYWLIPFSAAGDTLTLPCQGLLILMMQMFHPIC